MKRTTCLTTTALMGLSVVGAAPFGLTSATASTSAPAAAAAMCGGEAATLVGIPGRPLRGTEGRDVVVTNGADRVSTYGGNDLVCVTGNSTYAVNSGPGDDVVDSSIAMSTSLDVNLETGVDHFVGGAADDEIEAVPPGKDPAMGADTLDGGGGDDEIRMYVGPAASVIDNKLGRLFEGPNVLANWTSIEGFSLLGGAGQNVGDLDFFGGPAGEKVIDHTAGSRVARFHLGAGDDRYYGPGEPSPGTTISGDAGRDLFYLTSQSGLLDLDLASGDLSVGATSPYPIAVNGFEDAQLFAESVVLVGDNGPNELGLTACKGKVRGRKGSDTISRERDQMFETSSDFDCYRTFGVGETLNANGGAGHDHISGTMGDDVLRGARGGDTIIGGGGAGGGDDRLYGSRGHDRLEGQSGDDTLKGGRGWDHANGGRGRDFCHAERKRQCERH